MRPGDRGRLAQQLQLQPPARGRENLGRDAYLIDSADEIEPEWLEGKRIGVTAGASAPEVLVHDVIPRLQDSARAGVRELDGIDETIIFPLPRGITGHSSS